MIARRFLRITFDGSVEYFVTKLDSGKLSCSWVHEFKKNTSGGDRTEESMKKFLGVSEDEQVGLLVPGGWNRETINNYIKLLKIDPNCLDLILSEWILLAWYKVPKDAKGEQGSFVTLNPGQESSLVLEWKISTDNNYIELQLNSILNVDRSATQKISQNKYKNDLTSALLRLIELSLEESAGSLLFANIQEWWIKIEIADWEAMIGSAHLRSSWRGKFSSTRVARVNVFAYPSTDYKNKEGVFLHFFEIETKKDQEFGIELIPVNEEVFWLRYLEESIVVEREIVLPLLFGRSRTTKS